MYNLFPLRLCYFAPFLLVYLSPRLLAHSPFARGRNGAAARPGPPTAQLVVHGLPESETMLGFAMLSASPFLLAIDTPLCIRRSACSARSSSRSSTAVRVRGGTFCTAFSAQASNPPCLAVPHIFVSYVSWFESYDKWSTLISFQSGLGRYRSGS